MGYLSTAAKGPIRAPTPTAETFDGSTAKGPGTEIRSRRPRTAKVQENNVWPKFGGSDGGNFSLNHRPGTRSNTKGPKRPNAAPARVDFLFGQGADRRRFRVKKSPIAKFDRKSSTVGEAIVKKSKTKAHVGTGCGPDGGGGRKSILIRGLSIAATPDAFLSTDFSFSN